MSSVTVKISGQKEVTKELEKLVSKKLANMTEAIQVTQALIVNDAKSLVPVKTGFLQSSINAGDVDVDAIKGTAEGTVIADAEYASHVEFGTSRQRAQPYMVPAVIKNKSNFLARLKRAME